MIINYNCLLKSLGLQYYEIVAKGVKKKRETGKES